MDEVNETAFTLEEALVIAGQTERELDCLLSHFQTATPTKHFDGLGLSIILKEQTTFGDILLLVKHGRSDGASARLRSIWESLVILKYVVYCAPDLDQASYAFYLYEECKRANVLKANHVWNTLTPGQKKEKQEACDIFNALPDDIQQFVKRKVEYIFGAIKKVEAAAFPNVAINSIQVSQYDAIFRTSSMFVHGGLSGAHVPIQRFLGVDNDTTKTASNLTGILIVAIKWLFDIMEFWIEHSTEEQYKTVWTKCKDAANEAVVPNEVPQTD